MSEIKKKVFDNRVRYTLNGILHREDGPALELENGDKEWFQNGKLHREGGPAVEWLSGAKSWYRNGKRHREDGPAIEWINGNKRWFLNDEEVDFWDVWNLDDDKERKKRLCFYLDSYN